MASASVFQAANKELVANNKPPTIGSAVLVKYDNISLDGGNTYSPKWLKVRIRRLV